MNSRNRVFALALLLVVAYVVIRRFDVQNSFPPASKVKRPDSLSAQISSSLQNDSQTWYIPYERYLKINKDALYDFPFPFDPRIPRTPLEASFVLSHLTDATKDNIRRTSIPRIIHQTWKTGYAYTSPETGITKLGDPTHVSESIRSWREKNPDVGYVLWTDDDAEDFVRKLWPGIYPVYVKFPKMVMKADLFRYLVLSSFGGV
ncbi:hypothetical protein HK096_000503, partial [Nowakowskiella sp. JEL0078]